MVGLMEIVSGGMGFLGRTIKLLYSAELRTVLINDGTETQLASFRTLADDETQGISSYTFYGVMPCWVPLRRGQVEMYSGTGAVGRVNDG